MQNKDMFGVAKAVAQLKAEGAFEEFDKLAFPNGFSVTSSVDPDSDDYDPNEDPAYARALADKEAQWAEFAQARDWAIANWPTNKTRIKAQFPDLVEYELVDILKEVRYEMAKRSFGL